MIGAPGSAARRAAFIWLFAAIATSHAFAQATVQAQLTNVDVKGTNQEGGKATYTINGRAPQLPPGTYLHVTLSVQGIVPAIEAAFFRVTVDNGTFSGSQEWPNRTFPPMGYTTTVQLHMDAQAPQVRQKLQQEFGYTSDHIQLIATTNTQVGTQEQNVAHRKATLVKIRDLCDEARPFAQRLAARLTNGVAAESDPAWEEFATSFGNDLNVLQAAYDAHHGPRVVWGEAALWEQLGAALRDMFIIRDAFFEGETQTVPLQNLARRLTRLREEVESRLPVSLQKPLPGN